VELRDIEIFLTLADELHFGRTAERLHVTSARVSQAIKEMERRFGVLLFERTSRQVSLTPVGRQLRDDLIPGYRQIQEAIEKTTAIGRGFAGVLRVGSSSPWVGSLLVKAVDAFQTRHPDCEVQLQELRLCDRVNLLRSGALDLQLAEFPVVEPDVTAGPIVFSEERGLIVSTGHPFAGRESVDVEDLAGVPMVMVAGAPDYWNDFHAPHFTPAGKPIPRGPTAADREGILALVAAGKGVCVPALRARHYHSRPGIAYLRITNYPDLDYGFSWLSANETVKIREFVQTVLELRALEDGPQAVV
jgi:DNA-binding transcriptional LysR family regulator